MTHRTDSHLSADALNDVLIGIGSSEEAGSHLAQCSVCRGRVEQFRADLDALNTASLAWSEARSSRAPAAPVRLRPRRLNSMALGWAMAVAVLVALMIPLLRTGHFFPAHPNTALVSPPQDSEEQIAQDNDLLKAVNAAIHPDDVSPLQDFGLLERPHPSHRQRPK